MPSESGSNAQGDVMTLSLTYLCLFVAYSGIQNIETTLQKDNGAGYYSMATIYALMVVSAPISLHILRALGSRWSLLLAISGYWTYVATNAATSRLLPLLLASVHQGFCAGLLWITQAIYLADAAHRHAAATAIPLPRVLGAFSGMFWGMFAANQVLGNALTFLVCHLTSYASAPHPPLSAAHGSHPWSVVTARTSSSSSGGGRVESSGGSGFNLSTILSNSTSENIMGSIAGLGVTDNSGGGGGAVVGAAGSGAQGFSRHTRAVLMGAFLVCLLAATAMAACLPPVKRHGIAQVGVGEGEGTCSGSKRSCTSEGRDDSTRSCRISNTDKAGRSVSSGSSSTSSSSNSNSNSSSNNVHSHVGAACVACGEGQVWCSRRTSQWCTDACVADACVDPTTACPSPSLIDPLLPIREEGGRDLPCHPTHHNDSPHCTHLTQSLPCKLRDEEAAHMHLPASDPLLPPLPPPSPHPRSFFELFIDTRLLTLLPIILYSGMQGAFMSGDFTRLVVRPNLGVTWIGGAMSAFGLTEVLTGALASHLAGSPAIITAFLLAGIACQVSVLLFLLLLCASPALLSLAPILLLSCLWGVGESVLFSQLNAVIPVILPTDSDAALAHWQVWCAAGYSLVYLAGPLMPLVVKLWLLLLICLLCVPLTLAVYGYASGSPAAQGG